MDFIFKLCLDLYFRSKKVKTIYQALERLLIADGVYNFFLKFDSTQNWRNKRYWNSKCETVLKFKWPLLKLFYDVCNSFSAKK